MITNKTYSEYCLESSQVTNVSKHRLLLNNKEMSIQERIKVTIVFLKSLNIDVEEKVIERLRYLMTIEWEEEDKTIEIKINTHQVDVTITTTETEYSIKKVLDGVRE